MATTINQDRPDRGMNVVAVTLSAANDAVTFQMPRLSAMSIQVEGITTAAVALQASNDNSNFYALPTAVSLAADGIKSVAVADLGYRYYKILMTGASEAATVTVVGMEPR